MNRFIIDGFNLAFRAHFAFQTLMTSTGLMSGCIYGFLNTLKSLKIKYPNFEFFIVWDSYAKRKKDLYPDYKANRNHFNIDTPILDLKEILKNIKVTQVEAEGEEADDCIGTISQNVDGQVFIYSSDKDLLQLVVDGKIIVIRPKVGATAERIYDSESVFKEFGVYPKDFACYQSFRGDTSDNVPGVTRVPSKVLASLSAKYHDPDEVYHNLPVEELTDFQRKSIQDSQSQISVNFELVKLRRNLECTHVHGSSNTDNFGKMLQKYEIKSIFANSYTDLFEKNTSFLIRTGPSNPVVKTFSLFEE